ncbi:MAG: orotidine-5'-phosphate decarboxylase [Rickettsiales bacterium]|nr:orotidine-5'-phosphate decarboxylase [Rickettsiales bacterium]
MHNPIICAIDTTDVEKARELAESLAGSVGALKLGLEFFTANGAVGLRQLSIPKTPVFLDLKFHDIPNTVAGAIRATASIDTFMTTVHTAGGRAMLRAAIDASMEVAATTGKARPMVVGVTVLTSLDQSDLPAIGVDHALSDQVKMLADLAQQTGLDGVVCSPKEIAMLREHCGPDFKLVVPGIRPEGSSAGDQKRTLTPREALDLGADYLVIGRPITEAENPKLAAEAILKTLQLKAA